MVGLENPERDTEEYHRYIVWLENARNWMALSAIISAVAGLAASLADVSLSLYQDDAVAATSTVTVVSIFLLAVAICTSDRRDSLSWLGACAAIAAAFCASFPHVLDITALGRISEQLGFGRIGLDTTLIVILLAISAMARHSMAVLGLGVGLTASALVLNALIGQTYGLPYFDGEMALPTLIALIFAMVATASLYLHRPLIRVMFMSGSIGFRTRLMMAVGFLAPWGCGMLLYRWYGVPERPYHVEATLISAIIWIMLAVTLASGFWHEKADKKRRAAEKKLELQALTDTLTSLPNRAAVGNVLAARWARFHRFNVPVAIVLIDLDNFKDINDTFGHDIGDRVLGSMRDALAPHLRQDDVVARWGGEEFICVIHNTELNQLQRITERLRLAIREISDLSALSHGKGRVEVSASFGVSTMQKGDKGYVAAIKRADEAMYTAKRNGRDRVVFDAGLRPMVRRSVRPRSALTA